MATQAHSLEVAADPDAGLVDAAQQGDMEAFDKLVARHESRIFRLAERITGNAQEAEDVLQEAFLNAYRKLGQFHGESRFYTWLVRITVNQALMRLRRQKRRNFVSLSGEAESGAPAVVELRDGNPDPEQQFAAGEMTSILGRAIASLPAPYRIVFQLRDIEEFSSQETADLLRMSVPAVKSRLLRARLKLREILAPYFHRIATPASDAVLPAAGEPAAQAAAQAVNAPDIASDSARLKARDNARDHAKERQTS